MSKQLLKHSILIVVFSQFSCSTKQKEIKVAKKNEEIVRNDFQQIIDSADVRGSVLIYNATDSIWYSNDFQKCKEGSLPASTFKIPNSIIGLETGVVQDDSTLFKWNGEKRRLKQWEQDLFFRDAFHLSCVPCYQDIARRIGVNRMNEYLKKFNYGHMQVDSTSIDNFWLEGTSSINQYEQIDFLTKFYYSKLPISERTEMIMKRLMIIEEAEDYNLSGKTGWSIRNNNNTGWFVGFIETKTKVYFIATKIEPKESFNMDMFPKIRNQISWKAFEAIKDL